MKDFINYIKRELVIFKARREVAKWEKRRKASWDEYFKNGGRW